MIVDKNVSNLALQALQQNVALHLAVSHLVHIYGKVERERERERE